MPKLSIIGWNDGLQKVSMTKILRSKSGLGLKESKAVTDAVLDGEVIDLEIEDSEIAKELAAELTKIGAIVKIESN